ncbi:phospholipase, partial [Streptomyces sp. NPDC004976]
MRTPHALLATTVSAAALAATVMAPAPVSAADAVPPPGTYYVQSATTGLNASDAAGAVEQHRPRGDEDRQQWHLRADGTLENTDSPGNCLGRSGEQARTVGCASPEARWQLT